MDNKSELSSLSNENEVITGETSGGESEWLVREVHPLLNDLILDILFDNVRRSDLTECRRVCKKWNIRTIPHMRTTYRVTIHGNQYTKENGKRTQVPPEPDVRQVSNFVNRFYAKPRIPFEKFVLEPLLTEKWYGGRFLQLCGDKAKEIDLLDTEEDPKFLNLTHRIEDVSQLLISCPNLQVLRLPSLLIPRSVKNVVKLFPDSTPLLPSLIKLTVPDHSYMRLSRFCPTFFDELFTAAPNVSELTLEDVRGNFPSFHESTITDVLDIIEKLERESSIQSLHLINAEVHHVERLQRMGEKGKRFKLRSLSVEPNERSQDPRGFGSAAVQLATLFKDTLQSLHLKFSNENVLTEFPKMLQLKSLTFWVHPRSCRHRGSADAMETNLNKLFPALETLKLLFHDACDGTQYFSQFHVAPTVKSLHVYLPYPDMTIQTFHHVLRVFPNLTKLSLFVKEDGLEVLRQIWNQMTGLEYLSIFGFISKQFSKNLGKIEELDMDSVFTGIPTQGLEEVVLVVNELDKIGVEERRERIRNLRNNHFGLPSIANLTNLRHLRLNVDGRTESQSDVRLSDVTAYLAFYSMEHLRHLDVEKCGFTKNSCEWLIREMGLETWRFRNVQQDIIPPFLFHSRNNCYDSIQERGML